MSIEYSGASRNTAEFIIDYGTDNQRTITVVGWHALPNPSDEDIERKISEIEQN